MECRKVERIMERYGGSFSKISSKNKILNVMVKFSPFGLEKWTNGNLYESNARIQNLFFL